MMMIDPSTLSAESVRALRVIHASGIIRGFELQCQADLQDAEALKKAVLPLLERSLITVSGSLDAASIRRAQFAPLPSANEAANMVFKKNL